jgi:hypothetical protein
VARTSCRVSVKPICASSPAASMAVTTRSEPDGGRRSGTERNASGGSGWAVGGGSTGGGALAATGRARAVRARGFAGARVDRCARGADALAPFAPLAAGVAPARDADALAPFAPLAAGVAPARDADALAPFAPLAAGVAPARDADALARLVALLAAFARGVAASEALAPFPGAASWSALGCAVLARRALRRAGRVRGRLVRTSRSAPGSSVPGRSLFVSSATAA